MPERPGANHPEASPAPEPETRAAAPEIDAETLFRFLRDLKEGNAYADRVLGEFAELDPKARELLETPQSPNYHAEGPHVGDHYRLLLVALEMMRLGQMDFKTACTFLPIQDFEKEWNETVRQVQENPKMFEAFILEHDLGKSETVGYYYNHPTKRGSAKFLKKKSFQADSTSEIRKRAKRTEEYRQMYDAFAATHPGEDASRVAKLFYDAYEINVSYYGHEDVIESKENKQIRNAVEDRLGLSEDERRLVQFAIAQGGRAREKFKMISLHPVRAVNQFVIRATEQGLDGEAAMRFLSASLVVDVVLGSKKVSGDGTGWRSDAGQVINLWDAVRESKAAEAWKNNPRDD